MSRCHALKGEICARSAWKHRPSRPPGSYPMQRRTLPTGSPFPLPAHPDHADIDMTHGVREQSADGGSAQARSWHLADPGGEFRKAREAHPPSSLSLCSLSEYAAVSLHCQTDPLLQSQLGCHRFLNITTLSRDAMRPYFPICCALFPRHRTVRISLHMRPARSPISAVYSSTRMTLPS